MTSYALRNANPAKTRADAVVVGVVMDGKGGVAVAPGGEEVKSAYGRRFGSLLSSLSVTGKLGEVVKIPTDKALSSPLLVLVGLGEGGADSPAVVRRAAGAVARATTNAASVALALPAETPELVRAVTEGFVLGGYTFTRYRSGEAGKADGGKASEVVVLSPHARKGDYVRTFEEAQTLVEAVALTRDWVNVPPGDLTPPAFADAAVEAVRPQTKGKHKVTATVLDDAQLEELGCGGILGVGAGSSAGSRMVVLRYAPKGAERHLALVGKGVTFDSGGLSIKPAAGMKTMKSDMAGAATVMAATLAIARLELPVQVTCFAPMAENMLDGGATRPGDVLTLQDGQTVEITNTDAEGRLLLADGLSMAVAEQPDVVLDVATLTGAMVVALGDKVAGVMGSETVVADVLSAAQAAGEEAWPMPIPEKMEERVHSSEIADLCQSDWIRWGGGLFAAAFLREFTGGLPWAHLDIAGPSFASGASGHVTSGGTGYGVTTLVEYARALAG